VKTRGPLWLAGGIGPENVRETIEAFSPELLDASSRLESSPGIKDPVKLRTFFKEMGRG
jgi:indole-3-glycerol phosphate synthase/phosphoribosylanthranilate isomerase